MLAETLVLSDKFDPTLEIFVKFSLLPRIMNAMGYAAVIAIMVAAAFVSWNVRTGPYQQVSGIVQGISFEQTDGPAKKLMAVRLSSGAIV